MEPPVQAKILVLDFGSQYSHLIVRRCRELNVYCELIRCDTETNVIKEFNPIGIILSGGPFSVYDNDAPHVHPSFWKEIKNVPILGICYGMQEMHHALGGKVQSGHADKGGEYGRAQLKVMQPTSDTSSPGLGSLLQGVQSSTSVWMSHGDKVTEMAPGFEVLATSESCDKAVVANVSRKMWGVQFHPEVTNTQEGKTILKNFVIDICKAQPSWNMKNFASLEINALRKKVGSRHVIGALSGGVDSTVAAVLLQRAIGSRFHGIIVDTGLLRKDEGPSVLSNLRRAIPGLQLHLVDASDLFFEGLEGVVDPELKRKTVGHLFMKVFAEALEKLKASFPEGTFDEALLLQGTLYPDVIESVSFKGPSHTIKSHHNVGGLPERMNMGLLEPLRELFKDEVRQLGHELGLPDEFIWRHPFPGPGLAIRIIGEVTPSRAKTLRQADAIFIEELHRFNEYHNVAQAFAVLLPECRSVGVMGDQRSYGMTVALRAVKSTDFMTGDWCELPYEVLKKCSTRIINEVKEVNRVCYDISSKPPATIEWE